MEATKTLPIFLSSQPIEQTDKRKHGRKRDIKKTKKQKNSFNIHLRMQTIQAPQVFLHVVSSSLPFYFIFIFFFCNINSLPLFLLSMYPKQTNTQINKHVYGINNIYIYIHVH
ncbi:hypothetical protein, unlikely [Trypanosoma brucei gambiense DAL972]|uniref:Uncharacterized protein n=1 Tax=Trypanosoma brucei gambiense (strain MHOM/CI/86/DAL972) TaxID=679716 RepID=C9ZVM5_TRYB9|nr:hypothetical protein, unlikely [Trypanosoma brucei gambiense DAL972]CBH13463.1 hypothetical protein, unlikely [Trypanosoma brucei gambiense DAL972]|eukprot:XP_011775740.1 hypothetical protein, unlikely [Trypanosoma brucei gambiense DAL972]